MPSSPNRRPPIHSAQQIAFDNFEADLRSGELRKAGYRIRLQAQPFQLLALLLVNAGEVVTRDEMCRELWPGGTFVDFEHGLAAAVNKVREALGDSAEKPRYIETLPKRGYRFIGKIRPETPRVMPSAEIAEALAPLGAGPLGALPRGADALAPAPVSTQAAEHVSILVERTAPAALSAAWNWRAFAAVALLAIAALTAAAFVWTTRKPAAVAEQLPTIVPFTSLPGLETMASFSPDGSRIAFAWDHNSENETGTAKYDLYVKAIGSETMLKLTNHPSDVLTSTWSPDGTQIAFHRAAQGESAIYVVPALGGQERKLIATNSPWEITGQLSWSPDGKTIGYSSTLPGTTTIRAYLLNVDTLESREVPHESACRHTAAPVFSQSGKLLAMLCAHNLDDLQLVVMNADGSSQRSLTKFRDFIGHVSWTPNDASLILDIYRGGKAEIEEVSLKDGAQRKISGVEGVWAAVSNDGTTLAYAAYETRTGLWRKDLRHPDAAPEPLAASTQMQNGPAYSPDGKHIAFDSTRSGTWSVWLADADGTDLVQLSEGGAAGYPSWSPDSRNIVFQMEQSDGHLGLYVIAIGERTPHRLKTNVQEASNPLWSHDGKWIYFRGYENKSRQIFRVPAEGGDATRLLDKPNLNDGLFESADSTKIYFADDDGNLIQMALDSPTAETSPVPGVPPLSYVTHWAVTADGIYFVPMDQARSLKLYDLATKKAREVFHSTKNFGEGFALSPDGRYLIYSQVDENNADIMLARNFR